MTTAAATRPAPLAEDFSRESAERRAREAAVRGSYNQYLVAQIIGHPTREAAVKTIERLANLDPQVKKLLRRAQRARGQNLTSKRRGGRIWHQRVHPLRPFPARRGDCFVLPNTPQVRRDLASVADCVHFSKVATTAELILGSDLTFPLTLAPYDGTKNPTLHDVDLKREDLMQPPQVVVAEPEGRKLLVFKDETAANAAIAAFPGGRDAFTAVNGQFVAFDPRRQVSRRPMGGVDPTWLRRFQATEVNDLPLAWDAMGSDGGNGPGEPDWYRVPLADLADHPDTTQVHEVIGLPALAHLVAQAGKDWRPGENVTIAFVDVGINGWRTEFQGRTLAGFSEYSHSDPDDAWVDLSETEHGTASALIAAGATGGGGQVEGAAPFAGLISCRSRFYSDAAASFNFLVTWLKGHPGHPLVVCCPFQSIRDKYLRGPFRSQSAVPFAQTDEDERQGVANVEGSLDRLVAAGALVVFSAGNDHARVGGQPHSCGPTSIWRFKGRADVFTVGAVDLYKRIVGYSSRGPGEPPWHPGPATAAVANGPQPKPDLVVPTPRRGKLFLRNAWYANPSGWGTSGCAATLAGAAAAVWSLDPTLTAPAVVKALYASAEQLRRPGLPQQPYAPTCQGAGLLRVDRAARHLGLV